MGVPCPACKLRCCVSRINIDYAECPDHGLINGIVMLQCRGMVPWKALIEIRAAQAYEAIHRLADYHRGEILGAGIQRVTKHAKYIQKAITVPMKDDHKTYLFSYEHDGASWVIEVKASDPTDAQRRINRIQHARYDGELVAKITIPTPKTIALKIKDFLARVNPLRQN